MTKLEQARQRINEIDKEMARLFEERMDAAAMVAESKKETGMPVYDPEREAQLIERNSLFIKNEEYKPYYVDFLQGTMDVSKRFQSRLLGGRKIAYSGVEGAFAWIATKRIFPVSAAIAYPDFVSAYQSVVKGECDCAVLPIENSTAGDVAQVMDLGFNGSLYVSGVYDLEIMQNLLTLPGVRLSDVKEVVSHPQALAQCGKFLQKHGFSCREAVNTAVAAKELAESGRTDVAVIASKETAALYKLSVLVQDINESRINTTRFAVFSKNPTTPSKNDEHFIMYFTVKNKAGALGKAVSVIGENGFNLRALKSRPTKDKSWEYYFFAEGEGNIFSARGKKMLEELEDTCSNLKIVGSFGKEKKLVEAESV